MKYTNLQIKNALTVIRDVCTYERCHECPMRDNSDNCKITKSIPEEWVLNDSIEDWKAFK